MRPFAPRIRGTVADDVEGCGAHAAASYSPLIPCHPQAKYGAPPGWGLVTMPPAERKNDFCIWPQGARRGASWGSSPERLGTSAVGGGSVPLFTPAATLRAGPVSKSVIADPAYGKPFVGIAGMSQNTSS